MAEGREQTVEFRSRGLRRYSKYRDLGVQWLGEMPAHWEVRKLSWLTKCLDGRRVPLNAEERGRMQGDYPYWGANSIVDYVDRWLFDEELILLGEDGAPFFDRSRPVAFRVNGKIWVNNHAHVLRPRTDMDATFLAHTLNCVDYRAFIDGSTRDKLTQGDMREIPIQCPPVHEQGAIVEFLDRETAKIDALVAKKERLIELLQEKRTALITRAVTRGLDPNVPMKDSGIHWLGQIPAHWKGKKIKRLFAKTKRQGFPELTVLSVYRDYGVIQKSSRDDNFNRTPEDLSTYQVVNPGDLVINKMKAWQGSLGISSLSGITSPDYVVYLPRHQEERRFLHHFLRCKLLSSVYVTMSNGIRPNQWRLEPERFEELEVSLPPPDEQGQIAEFLDRETAKVDALVAKVRQAINHLNEYRTALISAAVTGKIDVRSEAA